MSTYTTEVQSTLEFPLTTEKPTRSKIHLLDHHNRTLCGVKHPDRAWTVAGWPSLPWADACPVCQQERTRPLVRLAKEVA
jgi:hypothetical protein